jgi:hypothetical protein
MNTLFLALLCTGYALGAPPYVPCGDVPEQGRCESPTKVVWCEDKQQKNLDCSPGTLCAWNELIASFDCIEASCADVPTTGHCLDPMTVAWCEDGAVHTLKCTAGTDCGWNEDVGSFDCVKVTPSNVSEDSDGSSQDANDGELDGDKDAGTTSDSGYVPPPHLQDGFTLDTESSGGSSEGGCALSHGGSSPIGALLHCLLFLLPWIALRRRPEGGVN